MKNLAFLLVFLALASCSRIDEIDISSFDRPDGEALNGSVAVFGNVTTEMRRHRVPLSPIHQWGGSQAVLPEINRVCVLCGNDTIPYMEYASEFAANSKNKTFIAEHPFKGEVGKTYKLVIETPAGDITAEDYLLPLGDTDYFQLMKDNTKMEGDQFSFPKHIYTLSEQPAICGITFYNQENCPIDSLNFWSFVHSDMSLQALFSAQTFFYSYQIWDLDHEEEFITCSVSPEFYSYLLGVFNESDWSMGLFATISGNVTGNVSSGYGYFFATDIHRKRFAFNELIPENE